MILVLVLNRGVYSDGKILLTFPLMVMELYLSGLYNIDHFLSHVLRFCKSSCSTSQSSCVFSCTKCNHLDLRLLLELLVDMEFLCKGDELGLITTLKMKAMLPVRMNGGLIKMVQELGDSN